MTRLADRRQRLAEALTAYNWRFETDQVNGGLLSSWEPPPELSGRKWNQGCITLPNRLDLADTEDILLRAEIDLQAWRTKCELQARYDKELPDWAAYVLSRLGDASWELVRPTSLGGPNLQRALEELREAEKALAREVGREAVAMQEHGWWPAW